MRYLIVLLLIFGWCRLAIWLSPFIGIALSAVMIAYGAIYFLYIIGALLTIDSK